MSEPAYPAPVRKQFNQRFWDGIENGQLLIQECVACGETTHPPRTKCPSCFGDLVWIEASGTGSIYSFGVVHRPNQPAVFDEYTPILMAVVELEEGPRMVSNLVDCTADSIAIGDSVSVVFEDVADGVTLPKFEPTK